MNPYWSSIRATGTPSSTRRARLAFGNPARVSLEDRKDLLLVRNRLTTQKTPLHLVNLPPRMSDKACDGATGEFRRALVPQRVERCLCSLNQRPAALHIRLHPLRMPLCPPRRAHLVEQFLDLAAQIPPLTPAAHRMFLSRPPRLPQQAPHRVPQQVDVGRIMHVGFDHERITPPAQWLARLFFGDLVTALHHQAPHRRQQLGRQQRHVVDHRLVLVMRLVTEVAVAQERAYRIVVVRQFMNTVEVATQPLLQDPKHQNLPQLHSRTPDRAVGLRKNMFVQQRKQPLAQLLVTPDVLKPLQHRRDVVPRLRVDPDFLDRHLPELELRSVNFSHDGNVAKMVPKWVDPWEITRKEYDISTIFATQNRRYTL